MNRVDCLPFKQLTADNQRAVDEDAVRQQEIFDVTRIAGRVFQQVRHQSLHCALLVDGKKKLLEIISRNAFPIGQQVVAVVVDRSQSIDPVG